ncbi:MAG: peptidoglycan DD-metalloendopeptidase family protein [Acidimicrobiia bacterium]|nr:peptidoglycan DD-metalloendopeptidase family protein [Acidimicrobiia bacterium]
MLGSRPLRCLAGAIALASTLAHPAGAGADPLAQARARVESARTAANAAAARYSEALTRYEALGDEIAELEHWVEAGDARAVELRIVARERAVRAYVHGQRGSIVPVSADLHDELLREELLDRVNQHDRQAVAQLGALTADLRDRRELLAVQRGERAAALDRMQVEREALDARLAEAQRAHRDLEARLQREAAARAAASRRSSASGQVVNPGGGPFVCPIQGPLAFTNDWGRPRSGGRRHRGTDLMSPAGTSNVAVVSGTMTDGSGGLGGIAVYLHGDDGVAYYYAHLSGIVGPPRRVVQGEVIGRTGNTGNARGGPPHTHFEMRVGGRSVNPYPTLARHC